LDGDREDSLGFGWLEVGDAGEGPPRGNTERSIWFELDEENVGDVGSSMTSVEAK
jgi:hypothetical protein